MFPCNGRNTSPFLVLGGNMIVKGNLIDCDKNGTIRIRENTYLIVESGIISKIYSEDEIPNSLKNEKIEDYKNALIIPGLIDMHLHAPQFSFRGLGMDMELLDWLNTYTFPEETKYKNMDYAKKAYPKFVKALTNSFTTRAVIFSTLHKEATVLLMDMLEKTGLKCFVGKVNMDRNSSGELIETTSESIDATREWLNTCKNRYKNTKPIITPRFIPSCSDELMKELGEIRGDTYGLQSHLSENPKEVEWVRDLCPDSDGYLDAYDKRGCLNKSDIATVMAHCVYSDEKEMELLKKRNVYVAHCPQSNICLSSGIAPIRKFLDRGIKVGLGSDIAAGYSLNILNQAVEAIGLSKLYWRYIDSNSKPLELAEAFAMATRNSGSYFGNIGAFEEGFEADILVIDDEALNDGVDDIRKRFERFLYLSDECSLISKYVAGEKIIIS